MPLEFDSFKSSLFIHLHERFQMIIRDYDRFIDFYFYIYTGLLPFIMYYNPFFIVDNLTNAFITLFYVMYGYDKIVSETFFNNSNALCFIVSYTFVFDMMLFKMYHDAIVYVFIIATIITKAEIIYTHCYTVYFFLQDRKMARNCVMLIDSYMADLENDIDDGDNNSIDEPEIDHVCDQEIKLINLEQVDSEMDDLPELI